METEVNLFSLWKWSVFVSWEGIASARIIVKTSNPSSGRAVIRLTTSSKNPEGVSEVWLCPSKKVTLNKQSLAIMFWLMLEERKIPEVPSK